jgi:hypothetical protein
MDIFEDYVVVYMKKRLIPTILIHDIKKKEKTKISLDSIGELKPRVNKVNEIKIIKKIILIYIYNKFFRN